MYFAFWGGSTYLKKNICTILYICNINIILNLTFMQRKKEWRWVQSKASRYTFINREAIFCFLSRVNIFSLHKLKESYVRACHLSLRHTIHLIIVLSPSEERNYPLFISVSLFPVSFRIHIYSFLQRRRPP